MGVRTDTSARSAFTQSICLFDKMGLWFVQVLSREASALAFQASLKQFVRGELLDGDNAYSCEKCGGVKRTTLKRTCISNLPQTLVIQLKRFEHDYDIGRAVKLNQRFTVEEVPVNFELNSCASVPVDARHERVHAGSSGG